MSWWGVPVSKSQSLDTRCSVRTSRSSRLRCTGISNHETLSVERGKIGLHSAADRNPRHRRCSRWWERMASLGDQKPEKKNIVGGAGYRSLCLMHAKHALYHLSYTPKVVDMINGGLERSHIQGHLDASCQQKSKKGRRGRGSNPRVRSEPCASNEKRRLRALAKTLKHGHTRKCRERIRKIWSMGVSIPLPADCEPTALPSELIPLDYIGPFEVTAVSKPLFYHQRPIASVWGKGVEKKN